MFTLPSHSCGANGIVKNPISSSDLPSPRFVPDGSQDLHQALLFRCGQRCGPLSDRDRWTVGPGLCWRWTRCVDVPETMMAARDLWKCMMCMACGCLDRNSGWFMVFMMENV